MNRCHRLFSLERNEELYEEDLEDMEEPARNYNKETTREVEKV